MQKLHHTIECMRGGCPLFVLSHVMLILTLAQFSANAHGQVGQIFERVPPTNPIFLDGAAVVTGALAQTDEFFGEGLYDEDEEREETFAATGSIAQSAGGGAIANAQVSGEASTLTPIGATTGVPEVEADLVVQLLADNGDSTGTEALAYATDASVHPDYNTTDTGAFARSDFVIGGSDAQYLLHGTLHLAAAGLIVGAADLNEPSPQDSGTTLTASIGGWFVMAEWEGDGVWHVTGELPAGVIIDEMTENLNDYYNFSIPVAEGAGIGFFSDIFLRGGAHAFGIFDEPPSTLDYLFSAQAWAVATPLGQSPILGDCRWRRGG